MLWSYTRHGSQLKQVGGSEEETRTPALYNDRDLRGLLEGRDIYVHTKLFPAVYMCENVNHCCVIPTLLLAGPLKNTQSKMCAEKHLALDTTESVEYALLCTSKYCT